MIDEKKDQALFDTIAEKYARKDRFPSSKYARKFQLYSLIELIREVRPMYNLGRVVEIGCGVGASAEYLAGIYETYVGLDYAEELIRIANQHYASEQAVFSTKNIKELKLDYTPDIIFANGVLHHIEDLPAVFGTLREQGNQETVYGFIEPQAGNPIIQFLRTIRKKVDASYSEDQVFFRRGELTEMFEQNGFRVQRIKYQGYFTPPLAQVMVKPLLFSLPATFAAIKADQFLQKRFDSRLAWNVLVVAQKA